MSLQTLKGERYTLQKTIWLPTKTFNLQSTLQLIDQANNSFEKNKFTLGIFINISKAFDTAEDKILISKLKNYGVRGNNSK